MKLSELETDAALATEMGRRLAHLRIDASLTQAELAEKAGLGRATVERMELGENIQIYNFYRVLRALNHLEDLNSVFPEAGPRPMDLLELKKPRQRVRKSRLPPSPEPWVWGDEGADA